jgi:ABC-type uncharacterized transport system ATPase subunit
MDMIWKYLWASVSVYLVQMAGKRNTVEMLEGLTAANEGSVDLLGQHWNAGDDRARHGAEEVT